MVLNATYLYSGEALLKSLELNCRDLDVSSVELVTSFTPLGPDGRDFVGHVASFGSPVPLSFAVDRAAELLRYLSKYFIASIRYLSILHPTDIHLAG